MDRNRSAEEKEKIPCEKFPTHFGFDQKTAAPFGLNWPELWRDSKNRTRVWGARAGRLKAVILQ
jgi:hypothetical protein